jgi:hypothetical protein
MILTSIDEAILNCGEDADADNFSNGFDVAIRLLKPSIKKLETEFSWQPTISLRESLRDHALWATQRSK